MNTILSQQEQSPYLLENLIYQDIYQYKQKDIINVNMLSSIILNKNLSLFREVMKNKVISIEEHYQLLILIVEEGDDYKQYMLELIKENILNIDQEINLFKKALVSQSIEICTILLKNNKNLKKNINIKDINEAVNKNPNVKTLSYIYEDLLITGILNNKLLLNIIKDDNIELLIYYSKNKKININNILNIAMINNAYKIIRYFLNKIVSYTIIKKEHCYENFFNDLITEEFNYVLFVINKCMNFEKVGDSNLEKLLCAFRDIRQTKQLLFQYHFHKINIKDKELKNIINQYIIEDKLQKKLRKKDSKIEIKKI